MDERQRHSAIGEPAIVRPAVILIPGRMGGILVKMPRAYEIVLPPHHAAQTAEMAFRLMVQVSSE